MLLLLQFLGARLLLIFDLKGNDKSLSLDQLWNHVMCNSFYIPIEAFYPH